MKPIRPTSRSSRKDRLFFHCRARLAFSVLMLSLTAIGLSAEAAESVSFLLQKGIFAEDTEGNPKAAIEIYKVILAQADQNRAMVAQALYRMALCHLKLGQKDEGMSALARLVREYPDQKGLVESANEKLPKEQRPGAQGRISQIPLPAPGWGFSVSKDGRYLSFHPSGGNVAVYECATGRTRSVATFKDGYGVWEDSLISPDNQRIVYLASTEDGKQSLCISSIDTPQARTLLQVPLWLSVKDWSPDGESLAVGQDLPDQVEQVALVSAADGRLEELARTRDEDIEEAIFSPDGQCLAYRTARRQTPLGSSVHLVQLSPRKERVLALGPAGSLFGWDRATGSLLFASDRSGETALWAVQVKDGDMLGEPRLVKANLGLVSPKGVTSDGRLFFSQQTASLNVYTAEIDFETGKVMKGPSLVTEQYLGHNTVPVWSPDGRWIGFNVERFPSKYVLLAPATGKRKEYSLQGKWRTPLRRYAWLPDHQGLLVMGAPAAGEFGFHLFRFDTAAATPVLTTKLGAGDWISSPQWIVEGQSFAFLRRSFDRSGNSLNWTDRVRQRNLQTGEEKDFFVPDGKLHSVWPFTLSSDRKHLALVFKDENAQHVVIQTVGHSDKNEVLKSERPWTISSLVWNVGDQQLTYVAEGPEEGSPDNEIWTVRIADGRKVQIKLNLPRLRWISLHPDGKTMAFQAGDYGKEELWVMEKLLGDLAQK